MARFLRFALLMAVVLAGCGEPGSEREGELGTIRGVVTLGPLCPVETEASPCPDEPLAGVEVRATIDGEIAASAVSGPDGAFSMRVGLGDYTLAAVIEDDQIRSSKPVDVHVEPGATVEVVVLVDTGIR